MNFVRHKVSKNKKRFQQDGFDLDLTYVTERIIAMGFPSSKREAYFRNPLPEVQRFFETHHKDHYRLYNLCAERRYDPAKFHDRVGQYPFYDHNAPPINTIQECLRDVQDWLAKDKDNVAGINCKAGKGRTGLIICCYLLESKMFNTTDEALHYYGHQRTKDGKGVTIASQIRYIRYYERLLKDLNSVIPMAPKIILTRLVLSLLPKQPGMPLVWIEMNNLISHRSREVEIKKKGNQVEIAVDGMCERDVKVQVAHKQGKKLIKICHFWFNTGFLEGYELHLTKNVIDVANKDKKGKIFKNEFAITAYFRAYNPDEPEEQFNNRLAESIAKHGEKRPTTSAEFQLDADGNDTESSFGLNEVDDDDAGGEKKPKKGKPSKKSKHKADPAPKPEEKEKKDHKKDTIDEKADHNTHHDSNNSTTNNNSHNNNAFNNSFTNSINNSSNNNQPINASHGSTPNVDDDDKDEEDPTPAHRPSFFKYNGYKLPLQISESDEESVDISENDPVNQSADDSSLSKAPFSSSVDLAASADKKE